MKTIDQESSKKITFIKQGRSKDKDITMAEVSEMRKMFVDMRKPGHDFGRARVRVDIRKSMVKQEMYVSAYTSRPVLKVKNTKTKKTSLHTFMNAILRFGKIMDLNYIGDA